MLITIDLGNTKLKVGLWEKDRSVAFVIYDTVQKDYRTMLMNFLYKQNVRIDQIDDIIMSSVVDSVCKILCSDIKSIFNKDAIVIDPSRDYGLKMCDSVRNEIGSDLLVMSIYVHELYKRDAVIISFGTASVISYVSKDGEFKNCIIAPGFEATTKALYGNAAKLPKFAPVKRDSFIASNTLDAMNVGIYDGYIGMIRYLLSSMVKELNIEPVIVACGGQGKALVPYIKEISNYEADIVSKGLFYIYRRYHNG